MNSSQIEKNLIALVKDFNKESFIYELLTAYGISKTSITRLKKGDFNLSKVEGEVLYKSKMLFKEVESGSLLNTIDELTKDPDSLKHNPRFVIVTDYKTLLAKDIRTGLALDTPILELHKHFGFFLPWAGQERYAQTNENFADRKASYQMAKLYDILVNENPNIYDDGGHNLNIFLSRLLFCFFAEDTEIFPVEGMFTDTLEQHTQKDGSDTHKFLDRLFKVLNTKDNSKEASHFKEFPFVNGGLFRDTIVSPKFNKESRKIILECGDLDWSEINPDIFGSMIQAVVNPAYRSGLGMHYTSVPNIMKVIEPLFLNELNEEFEKHKASEKKLKKLINRLGKIKIFDPACGSGNFLIIAYKELRKLEIKIWQQIDYLKKQGKYYISETVFTDIQLSQFYGIELDDFAHEMAILSLWLAEHQMNKLFVDELFDFGKAKPILPLKEAGNITLGNATRVNWEDTCPKKENDEIYILGNPPYLGSRKQKQEQKDDIKSVFTGFSKYKSLDYISCWFYLGAKYVNGSKAKLAFVSTNSICQGLHVSLIWPKIFNQNVRINFAHTSFPWKNNAKAVAGVTVIIVGLSSNAELRSAILFNEKYEQLVPELNGYLIPGKQDTFIFSKTEQLSGLPKINHGNMPADGGKFLFTEEEKNKFIIKEPKSEIWFKEILSAKEYLNGRARWCLWLEGIEEEEITSMPFLKKIIDDVREIRLKSSRPELAEIPHLFAQRTQPEDIECVIIPRVSSERRQYLPVGFINSNEHKVTDSLFTIATKQPYVFGIVSSRLHTTWLKSIGGKMKTDFQYSKNIVYNTFPFPKISQKQKEQINLHVFEVLAEREKHSGKTLAQLYDPDKMPKGLKEAHHQLDLAIERCYRLKPFESDTERLEYLFKEYEKMINKNTLMEKPKRKRTAKI